MSYPSPAEREPLDDPDDPWSASPWNEQLDDDHHPPWGHPERHATASALARARVGTPDLALLRALAAAEDALSRLDAAAAAAPEAVREGLAARLAFAEATGWLAHADAWVHPLDLALRDLNLTGTAYAAAVGGQVARALPTTYAGRAEPEPDALGGMVAEDGLVTLALGLARALRRVATHRTWRPLATTAAVAAALTPLGLAPGTLDATRLDAWQRAWRRDATGLPPLLAALGAAASWAGAVEPDAEADPAIRRLRSGLMGALVAATTARVGAVPLPLWAAVPRRPATRWRDSPWPPSRPGTADARDHLRVGIATLELVAEGARAGRAELARLLDAAAAGAQRTAGLDRRSRLADAVTLALRTSALTPGALARALGVAPQTATALLRDLAAAGVVREATGRRSFRAFAT